VPDTGQAVAAPSVRSGHVTALRLFDVAYGIDLRRAEELWAQHAGTASSRARLVGTPAKAVRFDVPPLTLTLDPIPIQLGPLAATAGVTARIYDFGVVALGLRVQARDQPWADFSALANLVHAHIGPEGTESPWESLMARVRALIDGALVKPTDNAVQEDYLVATVHAFDERLTADALQDRVDLIPLLSGEERRLSEPARRDLLRQSHSYYTDDLVVLTWDRAFIYEPRGDSDVADVLEVANAQLLEMRAYDELLDAELPRMYDRVEDTRRPGWRGPARFAAEARRLYTLVAEVTELTERVDNALQVTEDVYLARIYSAALDQFRVRLVSAAVDRKLTIIRDTYAALYDEASSSRAGLVEWLIVALIALEVGLALVRH
jgi:hypothetical protein